MESSEPPVALDPPKSAIARGDDGDDGDEEYNPIPNKSFSGRKEINPDVQLERLRAFFEENGVVFESGWRVEVKQRLGGSSAGTSDAYYFSPDGKRYRSRVEIARDYGIQVQDRRSSKSKMSQERPIKQGKRSREEAFLRAQQALSDISLPVSVPLRPSLTNSNSLSDRVVVRNLGKINPDYVTETKLHPIGYAAQWTDSNGSVFDCVIEDDQDRKRPVYKVYQDQKEVGRGEDPQAAWYVKGSHQPGWNSTYGTQRFGFASQTCLAALEGLEGVEQTKYVYVEQRSTWDEELLLRQRLKKTPKVSDKGKAKTGDKDAAVVAKVMENMLKQLEQAESRALAKRQRQADKQKLKDEKKEEKLKGKRAARELLKFQKAELRRAAGDVIKSAAADADSLLLLSADELLPTAKDLPPTPSPLLSSTSLPPTMHPCLLELWHLMHRFRTLFGIPDPSTIPSIPEIVSSLDSGLTSFLPHVWKEPLEGSVENGIKETDHTKTLTPALWVVITMLRLLIDDLYHDAVSLIAESNDDVRESDLRPLQGGHGKTSLTLSSQLGPLELESWQEACHRLFALVADATVAWQRDGKGGVPSPITDAMDPFLVLEYLAAAPPTRLATGIGALPPSAAPHAWHGIQAVQHARALAMSRSTLFPATITQIQPSQQDWICVQRYILHRLCSVSFNKNDASCLFWQGQSASAAQKSAIPLDLRSIAARVDAGWYGHDQHGLEAMASDVMYMVNLHQSALSKTSSAFAEENEKTNVAEIGALIADEMETLKQEVERQNEVGSFLALHKQDSELAGLWDLGVPFCPVKGACVVCWDTEDQEKLMECQSCGLTSIHTYCSSSGDYGPGNNHRAGGHAETRWTCGRSCCRDGHGFTDGNSDSDNKSNSTLVLNDRVNSYWSMAQRLGKVAWSEWTPADRMELIRMLCTLVTDAPAVREALGEEEGKAKEMRKELTSKRNQLKQLQQAIGQQQQVAALTEQQTRELRELRDAVADRMATESLVKKISQLEHELSLIPPPRLDPLGLDRHWNRYWLVPAAAIRQPNSGNSAGPGAILIEYADGSGKVGLYDGAPAMASLISWLNPLGVREKLLEIALRRARAEMQAETQNAPNRNTDQQDHEKVQNFQCPESQAPLKHPHQEESLERLRERMLDFESGLLPGARHPVLGSQQAMDAWRKRVADPGAVSTPAEFLAALILLESSINPTHLRLHWKVWAVPAPEPSSAHLPSAVWLRFNALKAATKLKVHLSRGVKDLMIKNLMALNQHHPHQSSRQQRNAAVAGGRTQSDSKQAKERGGEDSLTTSGQERVRGKRGRKLGQTDDEDDASVATSPSKRTSKQATVDNDEEYARKLDAELNSRAGRPSRTSRLRNASSAMAPSRKRYRTSLRGAVPMRGYKETSSSEMGMNSGDDDNYDDEDENDGSET